MVDDSKAAASASASAAADALEAPPSSTSDSSAAPPASSPDTGSEPHGADAGVAVPSSESTSDAPSTGYYPLARDIALAASALCEASGDDEVVAELLRRYWGLDEPTAERAVREARGRLLFAPKDKPLALTDILKLDEYSFQSIGDYMETYVEENAETIRTGVKGGGIKFVVSQTLKFLYSFFYKYLAVFIEPLVALLLKIFPFLPLP